MPAANIHETTHLTNSAWTVPSFRCGPVTQSHRATSCNSAPHPWTPLHQALCPPGSGRARPEPLATGPANGGARGEVYLNPQHSRRHTTSGTHSHNPAPTARRLRGPCSPCAPRTPQLRGAGRPTPPPLCLAPTPSPSQQLAAPARAPSRPTPPPTCPTEGWGAPGCTINPSGGKGARPPPRPWAIAPPGRRRVGRLTGAPLVAPQRRARLEAGPDSAPDP